MRLLLIRHGIAEERQAFAKCGEPDAARPLTKSGRRKMRKAADGLKSILPGVDLLATSPLVRAVQTGEIVAEAYDGVRLVQIAPLSPGKTPTVLLNWLQAQPREATLALVGHEPGLGIFASWMLTGLPESFIAFKKGGACLLELATAVRAGRGKLLWSMKPSQLRALG